MFLFKNKRKNPITINDIVGSKCAVVDTVDNYIGSGLVKVGGQIWAARSVSDDDVFEIGESLVIVAIEGAKLICRKK